VSWAVCSTLPGLEWSRAFRNAPIYIPESSRQWVMRPDPMIRYWTGDAYTICDGVTMVRCGGHFEGSCVLHWRDGAGGKGAIFAGDTIMVVSDRRYVSFMYSYPNYIPMNAATVKSVVRAVEPYAFDRIYSAWKDRTVMSDAKAAIERSVERYIKAIEG
jgi:glyoxylase-like metal-dependent hydrolase (beta-lactamase superfamily II)